MEPVQFGRDLLVEASTGPTLKRVMMRFLDRAAEVCQAHGAASVVLHDSSLMPFEPLESFSRRSAVVDVERWPAGGAGSSGPLGEVCGSARPVWVVPAGRPDLAIDLPVDTVRALLVPLVEGRTRVLGVLQLGFLAQDQWGEHTAQRAVALSASCIPAFNRAILLDRFKAMNVHECLVGGSSALLDLERRLKDIAQFCEAPVLVRGERGTGKELLARALHCWSRRRRNPFVPVLSSALAESLVADDLFGHEKHAFTGATASREGRFVAAGGGSLFLDEVGDLPAGVQSALLRVLERGELSRIGRDLPVHVDVRIISATNRNLEELMEQGLFRYDLFDRLSTLCLEVPPLRDRLEDIPRLADFFLRKHCRQFGRQGLVGREIRCTTCGPEVGVRCADAAFYEALQQHDWPGNIRELKNVLIRAAVGSPDETLGVKDLPEHFRQRTTRSAHRVTPAAALDDVIRAHLEYVLECSNQNQSEAARVLGLPLSTMRNKMRKLGLELKPRPKEDGGALGGSGR